VFTIVLLALALHGTQYHARTAYTMQRTALQGLLAHALAVLYLEAAPLAAPACS
jgi:uncharacterized membrane protein YgdD (TMEM256/DUF423 family)